MRPNNENSLLGFPTRPEREKAASTREFARTNRIWNAGHFNAASKIGQVFSQIRCANQEYLSSDSGFGKQIIPLSYWEDYYFSQVRTPEEILAIAHEFQDQCIRSQLPITSRQAICFTVYRIIDQTYDGLLKEMLALLILQVLYPEINFFITDDFEDRHYGVDFIGKRNGHIVKAYQQKPERFFKAVETYCQYGSPDWVKSAIETHVRANSAFERKYHIPVEYISLAKYPNGTVQLIEYGSFEKRTESSEVSYCFSEKPEETKYKFVDLYAN